MGRICIERLDSDQGVQPEISADAEAEILDARDKNQGRTLTNEAVSSETADATGSSTLDVAAEKDTTMRRLGELHRLLNSRKGSLHATYKKNTDANDEAYDSIRNLYRHWTLW